MSTRSFVVLLVAIAGCYRYTPIQGNAGDIGQSVRVQLTEQGSINLAPLIGPTILTLDGSIRTVRDTVMSLAVTKAIARNGVETSWKGEPVDVPRAAIRSVQQRDLDKRRSWMLAVGGVAGTAALGAAWNLLGGGLGGKNAPQNGGPR